MFLETLLFSAAPAGSSGAQGGGSSIVSIATFALLFLVMYFLLIRPQSKRRKEQQLKLSRLQPGDEIVSIGGIHGTIVHVDGAYVIVKVDETTKLKFTKEAVSTVIPKASAPADAKNAVAGGEKNKKTQKKTSEK